MSILPMKAENIGAWIERGYREGGPFQWARETAMNAIEAHATRVEFGVEWQAVEKLGVYRRMIADNGRGMDDEELVDFMRTMGGGGKAVGDEHGNFGIGVKTSACPWNKSGIVIVSWRDGNASMVRIVHDEKAGQYGLLEVISNDDEKIAVYQPYIDGDGIDWSAVRPDWMANSDGTVLVLLGNNRGEDTVRGDSLHDKDGTKHISRYLNLRFWKIRQARIDVQEFSSTNQDAWPKSRAEAAEPMRTFTRTIRGAEHYILGRHIKLEPTVRLEQGSLLHEPTKTTIHWYLWIGGKPKRTYHYAPATGFIAVLYKDELYHMSQHGQSFRAFGVSEEKVRSNLWLVIEPPEHDKDKRIGVYPRGERDGLKWHAGRLLPMPAWAEHFSMNMPQPIINALKEARGERSGMIEDESWKQELAARYASLWKVRRYRHEDKGVEMAGTTGLPSHPSGGEPNPVSVLRPRPEVIKPRRPRSKHVFAGHGDDVAAREVMIKGNLPEYHRKREPLDSEDPHLIAAYNPPSAAEPAGSVDVYVEHPVIVGVVKHWQAQYPTAFEEEVREEIEKAYCKVAVSKIAHSEQLTGLFNVEVVAEMRQPRNLTFALLGVMSEDALIAERLRKVLKVRKVA
jgi:Histidine kinase-, DNA gyrase B-, and HSP90-like ATPase